jgi:hypothetical protein
LRRSGNAGKAQNQTGKDNFPTHNACSFEYRAP